MPHQRSRTQGFSRQRQQNLNSHRLTRQQFSRQNREHPSLAKVDRAPVQSIWDARTQHSYIHGGLHAVAQPAPPPRLIPISFPCRTNHAKSCSSNQLIATTSISAVFLTLLRD